MINPSATHRQYRPSEVDALKRSRWLSYRRQKAWLKFLQREDQDERQWQEEGRYAETSREGQ